jgi:HPt (histidine-containing phosphotransfer) domain-containing protein
MDAPSKTDTAAARADLGFWRDLAGGDDEGARDLLTLYLEDTSAQISLMVSALAAGSADQVGRAAHACAGSSGTCGVDTLAELFRRLEQQARGNRLDELSVTLPLIVETFTDVRARLTKTIAASSEAIQEPL